MKTKQRSLALTALLTDTDKALLPITGTEQWWSLDQLNLGVAKVNGELRLDFSYATPVAGRPGWCCQGKLQSRRIAVAPAAIALTYKLADRAVVARLATSLSLPGGAETRLWISSTLWLCLQADDTPLLELPAARLSDTWFGPHTRKGELCYAARSKARAAGSKAGNVPYKAITPVTIINQGKDMMQLEKVNLPVVHLSLYRQHNQFWTSALQVVRTQADAELKVVLESGAPLEAAGADCLQPPRKPVEAGVLYKAKDWLLG